MSEQSAPTVLQCKQVNKIFDNGGMSVDVLSNINLAIAPHTSTAIMGPSGCGKSTLLQIMGGLEPPSSGRVCIGGQDISTLDKRAIAQIRNQDLGFVYQFHHLLGDLSALENVIMPLLIGGMARNTAKQRGMAWLQRVGLVGQDQKKPAYLSGGERQRVAIARALVHAPKCVLADEPTANLDKRNAELVLSLLLKLCVEDGSSLVLVTHDCDIAQALQQTVEIMDGKLDMRPKGIK
jgi:lipoprotein-releasing system ATP-binding protein